MQDKFKKLANQIKTITESFDKNFDRLKIENIFNEFDKLCIDIISDKKTPPNVKEYIANGNLSIDIPNEYAILNIINKFRDDLRKYLERIISKEIKKNHFLKISNYITFAISIDIKNIVLFDLIENYFKEYDLYKELIELYRTAFIHTTDAVYFEKIGDIQYLQKDYHSAIDSYLSYAETNGPTEQIYDKLALVFEKLNDEDSRLACIEQKKLLEGSNE